MLHGLLIIKYQVKIILYIPKNRKVKKKVSVEFLSFNTYISIKKWKLVHSIQLPSILMILFCPLHYKSRQGQAEGEVFPKMQLFVPWIKDHFRGVILPHPRFKGERSINHYPKYSLILRVFHYPTPEGKGRDPRLPILHTASRRPRTPSPKCSWFSGSFITPPQRWEGETLDIYYP